MVVSLKKNEISDDKIKELMKLGKGKSEADSFWIRT
jgi:hypothetical protein